MLRRLGKWAVIALVGVLVLAGVAVVTSLAQGPAPERTPQSQAACPVGGPRMGLRLGGSMLQTLAGALNMEADALVDALRNGKTVAELAKAQNVTIEQVVDKIIAARKPLLQQAVDAGRITQEQMDAALSRMREMVENLQNGTCTPGLGRGQGCGMSQGQGCGLREGQSCGMGRRAGKGSQACPM